MVRIQRFRAKLALALAGAGVLTGLAMPAQADMLFGVYAGVGTWQQQPTGELQSGGSAVDVETDLGLEEDVSQVGYLAIEHPIPVLANQCGGFTCNRGKGFFAPFCTKT